ncbi:MAG: S-methyl-5-thioribose-1-phosphate isomerase [Bdellovibrionales bacterium]|nr:S-methyl-5-thioribose-1-phosphate isomerase [Bdellovibrionales bacterium]
MKSVETLAIKYQPGKELLILDQTLLPEKIKWIPVSQPEDMYSIIKGLKVRGANLIGISAAFSLADYALRESSEIKIQQAGEKLKSARPTAIHLFSAVDRILKQTTATHRLETALQIYEEDKKACEQIAQKAKNLIHSGDQILTYCNAGSLATGGEGTSLGVIKQAHKDKKKIHVYVCETRPVNQGSRLTFWELQKEQIPCTLICDNMAAGLMAQKKVNTVFLGADRISNGGDVANKTGTLSLAVISRHFQVPFYVVAPESAFDRQCLSGQDIPIEQRNAEEISPFWADKGSIYNPSFDVTPASLITGIITEKGIFKPKSG